MPKRDKEKGIQKAGALVNLTLLFGFLEHRLHSLGMLNVLHESELSS